VGQKYKNLEEQPRLQQLITHKEKKKDKKEKFFLSDHMNTFKFEN